MRVCQSIRSLYQIRQQLRIAIKTLSDLSQVFRREITQVAGANLFAGYENRNGMRNDIAYAVGNELSRGRDSVVHINHAFRQRWRMRLFIQIHEQSCWNRSSGWDSS